MQCCRVLYCEISHEWLDFGLGKCVCRENHVTIKGLNAPCYFFSFFRHPTCFGRVIQIPPWKFFFYMTVTVFFGWDAVFACQGKSWQYKLVCSQRKKATNRCWKQVCTSCLVFCWVAESTFLRQSLTAFMCLQLVNSEDTQLLVGFKNRGMQKLNWIGLLSAALMFLQLLHSMDLS